MMQFPQDDKKLVAFIRRHRPVPPPSPIGLEQRLMSLVEKEAVSCHKTAKMRCLIPTACAAALMFVGSIHNWLTMQQQTQFTFTDREEELETFLSESWQGTVGEATNASYPVRSEAYWLTLADLPAK